MSNDDPKLETQEVLATCSIEGRPATFGTVTFSYSMMHMAGINRRGTFGPMYVAAMKNSNGDVVTAIADASEEEQVQSLKSKWVDFWGCKLGGTSAGMVTQSAQKQGIVEAGPNQGTGPAAPQINLAAGPPAPPLASSASVKSDWVDMGIQGAKGERFFVLPTSIVRSGQNNEVFEFDLKVTDAEFDGKRENFVVQDLIDCSRRTYKDGNVIEAVDQATGATVASGPRGQYAGKELPLDDENGALQVVAKHYCNEGSQGIVQAKNVN